MAFLTGAFFLGACVDRRVSRVDERRRETLLTPRGTAFFLGAACAEERVSGGTIRLAAAASRAVPSSGRGRTTTLRRGASLRRRRRGPNALVDAT